MLIDSVTWSDAYPMGHPLRNVSGWFGRHIRTAPGFSLEVAPLDAGGLERWPDKCDAVIISGSPRDAWADDPLNEELCQFIHRCREEQTPILGVCFGHQILARALGGEVGPSPNGLELGNTEITLTQAGVESPLFHGLPRRFPVLQGHRDAVLQLPAECALLATGTHTWIQAFRWSELFFGVQFHPEMDPDILRFLWEPRRAAWRDRVSFDLDHVLDNLRPAVVASRVITNFLTYFVK